MLRAVHRLVGGPEESVRRLEAGAGRRDSEARLDAQCRRSAVPLEPIAQTRLNLHGTMRRRRGEKDCELVAADPVGPVTRPQLRLQKPADANEALVSSGVAVPVVQLFEAVEVEHHQRERRAGLSGFGERALELADEGAPVRQLRERVVVGEVTHLLELGCERERAGRLVGEDPQRLEALLAGQ